MSKTEEQEYKNLLMKLEKEKKEIAKELRLLYEKKKRKEELIRHELSKSKRLQDMFKNKEEIKGRDLRSFSIDIEVIEKCKKEIEIFLPVIKENQNKLQLAEEKEREIHRIVKNKKELFAKKKEKKSEEEVQFLVRLLNGQNK